jgi:hypothetical protein
MTRPFYKTDAVTGGGPAQYISAEHKLNEPWEEQAHNVRLVGHSDLNGWGDAFQIQVSNGICYVAASGVNGHDGMTILDVKDPSKPTILNQISDSPGARTHKVLKINETDGMGIHRPIYDRDRKLMYSSGYRDGFDKKILLIHDMKDPSNPEFVGQGWVEGQKDGEEYSWDNSIVQNEAWCHEGNPWGNFVTAGWWDGGIVLFDCTDPSKPEFKWRHNPHETHGWAGCYHSFLVPKGSDFGIVTQETVTVNCEHPPAFVTFYDLRNKDVPLPVSTYMPFDTDPLEMRPTDSKWSRTGARHGAHNIWLDMEKNDLIYIAWFNAGLRIIDWSNPFSPKEVGSYIPAGNKERCCPQSNDVYVDRETGLIYMSDRWGLGLHILEYTGS